MDIATKCQTHDLKTHYGPEHIEREIYNEKGFSIGAELFEEIVRCKDCKHKVITEDGEYNPEDIVCEYWMSDGLTEKDFCSYGERSEE